MRSSWVYRRFGDSTMRLSGKIKVHFHRPALEMLERRLVLSTLQFDSAAYSVNVIADRSIITVLRDASTQAVETVDYATSDGSAAAGFSYLATAGTLTFQPGVLSQTFAVPIVQDAPPSPTRSVHLQLSNPGGGAVLGSQATALLTIQDSASYVDLNTLSAANAVWPGGFHTTSLQYAPDQHLAQLFWIKNAQGTWNLTYVESTNFGNFRTVVVTGPVDNPFPGSKISEDILSAAQLLFDSSGAAHALPKKLGFQRSFWAGTTVFGQLVQRLNSGNYPSPPRMPWLGKYGSVGAPGRNPWRDPALPST